MVTREWAVMDDLVARLGEAEAAFDDHFLDRVGLGVVCLRVAG